MDIGPGILLDFSTKHPVEGSFFQAGERFAFQRLHDRGAE